ncbi:helix-turn-helix transcriptional regulator [Stutzerimonas azotifigens]|uniref:helix-turn-helix transcriptional regulator n=1 Tax=Stutzerimonas azotifigens TaxID=291995 RepID=UPI000487C55E|nr:response regulator transcription factor [Stutzerimonas azotifigens]
MIDACPASSVRLVVLSRNESLVRSVRRHLHARTHYALAHNGSVQPGCGNCELLLFDSSSFPLEECFELLRQLSGTAIALINTSPERARRLIEKAPSIKAVFYPDAAPEHFVQGVKTVLDGGDWLPRALLETLVQHYRQVVHSSQALDELSTRERQIMLLAGKGLSNAAIAAKLHLSTHTVKSHVHNALRKLGATNRAQGAAMVLGHSSESAS